MPLFFGRSLVASRPLGMSLPFSRNPAAAALNNCDLFLLLLFMMVITPVAALNTCEEITRCSECVYDQTQGIMPPSLLCGWCESTRSCKQVNASVLAYYGATTASTNLNADDNGQDEVNTHTPEEMAAFRAAFCEDLRERDLNGVCPDMSCAAAKTTNNIYICRPPPLIALVFGCVLLVLTVVVYMWMRTIRQLPWKYEPFLSDLLEGRTRTYEEHSDHDRESDTAAAAVQVGRDSGSSNDKASTTTGNTASPQRTRAAALNTTRPGSPLHDRPHPMSHFQTNEMSHDSSDNSSDDTDDDDDLPSAETASTVSNPSYLDNVSHNVVVAHHPHDPASMTVPFSAAPPAGGVRDGAAAAATGYCPICKCRQPACLGPGEVCFWCNVARFIFVPFFIALVSSVFVIVLDFAVSLKPWFSDWYFAEVLVIAYTSYAALGFYMVRHHGRVPLFFLESEAEQRANQSVWSSMHDRPSSQVFSTGDGKSSNNSNGGSAVGGSRRRRTAAVEETGSPLPFGASAGHHHAGLSKLSHHHRHNRQKLRMLNDARRNMASTYYVQLAMRLRGRPLLTCFPELQQYAPQLEAMQAQPATLTSVVVGDAVALLRPSTPGSRANSAPGSPQDVPPATHRHSANAGVPITNVPVISPFAAAAALLPSTLPPLPITTTTTTTIATSAAGAAPKCASAALVNSSAGFHGASAEAALPGSISSLSPSVSSACESGAAVKGRLPLLEHIAATTPQQLQPAVEVGGGGAGGGDGGGGGVSSSAKPAEPAASAPGAAAAALTPSAAPAGGPIGSPAATSVPESLARQKRGETVQLLSSNFLSPQYCRALKSALYRDEYITWCSKPNLRGVLMENEWLLLDLAVGFLFGLWMVLLSSVNDTTYTIVELSGSTAVATCGLIVMVLFALLLVIVVRQCGRLYVLTNERLITVYESVITPVTTATDLSTVRFAALYGYRGLWSKHPCLTFSWEIPATERKMPAIKSHKFPGIMHLQEFLFFFRLVAPQTPFHLEQISESTRQDRQEWRLHIFLSVGGFVVLPIVTIYPQMMPDFLSFYLYVLGLLLIFSTLLRGFRAQQMTYAPLNIAASWAQEGELNELSPINASRTPPPAPRDSPQQEQQQHVGSAAAATSAPAAPSPQPLPHATASMPSTASPTPPSTQPSASPAQDAGATASRSAQVATQTTQFPMLDLNKAAAAASMDTATAVMAGSPQSAEDRVVMNEPVPAAPVAKPATPVAAVTAAAAAKEGKPAPTVLSSGNGRGTPVPSVSVTLPPKPAKTSATTTSPNAATTAAAAAGASLFPSSTTSALLAVPAVPVTSAVREMEESLTGCAGVGVTGSGLSANNSFSYPAGVHATTSASHGSAARNSPHPQRLPSFDVSATSSTANTGMMSIGPGAGSSGRLSVNGAPTSSANLGHYVHTGAAPGTMNSTSRTSPTNFAPPSALVKSVSTPSNPHRSGSPQEHDGFPHPRLSPTYTHLHRHPPSMSPSESEGAMSAASTGSLGTVAIAHYSSSIGEGSGKAPHHASQAHVVPASVRSTKPDAHTTWGDQVAEYE